MFDHTFLPVQNHTAVFSNIFFLHYLKVITVRYAFCWMFDLTYLHVESHCSVQQFYLFIYFII
jgi:hypothetical protein